MFHAQGCFQAGGAVWKQKILVFVLFLHKAVEHVLDDVMNGAIL